MLLPSFSPILQLDHHVLAYTGNGAARNIANYVDTDLLLVKRRDSVTNHYIFDSVRGADKAIILNSTASDSTESTAVTAFLPDGFSLGTGGIVNTNTAEYISFGWKELSAYFDIVGYTGTGVQRTVSHNLGATPKFMIVKPYSTSGDWAVYHEDLGATQNLEFADGGTLVAATSPTLWGDTAPNGSVFTVDTANAVNTDTVSYIAYLFGEVAGKSDFGEFTDTGSDQSINCGFTPKTVLIKRTSTSSEDWLMFYKVGGTTYKIKPSNTDTEAADATTLVFTATGFDVDSTLTTGGASYVYAAWA